jgi:hypothetical protein
VGYLFLDGEYLSPPYEIRTAGDAVTVNDRAVNCRLVEPENDRRWRNRAEEVTAQALDDQLQVGGIVLAFPDQPLVTFPDPHGRWEFFSQILGRQVVKQVSLVERLPREFDRQIWDDWVKAYQPPIELRQRAEADLSVFEKAAAEGEAVIAAARRLNQFSYPLTMVGMIATVLGFGHLLSHKPATGGQPLDKDASPDAVRVISWSLLLVVVLSALDLAWTILAYQAGQMREMNPFGSHLVENPQQLMMFKAGATLVTVGLLFGLRTYRRAQLAAWWACLILTLLTARWLTLNSMFIAV